MAKIEYGVKPDIFKITNSFVKFMPQINSWFTEHTGFTVVTPSLW